MSGWFQRLKEGLSKTSSDLSSRMKVLVTHRKLDDETLETLEEILISADMGVITSQAVIADLRGKKFGQDITTDELKEFLAENIAHRLESVEKPWSLESAEEKPQVILMIGVNGSGKTTTIGKLVHRWEEEGKKIRVVAGDTFRAAATAQLQGWISRSPMVAGPHGSDSASLAFQGIEQGKQAGDDVVIIDTAGRLHNKSNLMDELEKMIRVIKKINPEGPHECWLVLDGTTGQNAHSQVSHFLKSAPITGLVITKLDGTSKAGVVVGLSKAFGLPIRFIGIGEKSEDLKPFDRQEFSKALVGL
jgi:fused signal recognition particle receptor